MYIKQVNNKDLAECVNMMVALWPEYSKEELTEEFKRIINSKNDIAFVAKEGEDYQGFITLSLRFEHVSKATSSPVGYVEGIYVKEKYRKTGVARKLYEEGEKWVKNKGCTQMGSDTWDWNKDSILFHDKLGFKIAETLVHFIKDIK